MSAGLPKEIQNLKLSLNQEDHGDCLAVNTVLNMNGHSLIGYKKFGIWNI